MTPPDARHADLLHFAPKFLRTVKDVEPGAIYNGKPKGLWVSAGAHWLEWCHAESFHLEHWKRATRVHLAPDANVLHIATVMDLDDFHRAYAVTERFGGEYPWSRARIDWPRVGQEYDGIVIAPYQWERCLNGPVSDWYYGWDVASGCIWRARAIARLEPLRIDPASLLPTEEAA